MRARIPPPVFALTAGAVAWLLNRYVPVVRWVPADWSGWGWCVIALGAGIIATAMIQFRRAQTTIDPREPSKATAFVRSGIFAVTRNPMYLGLSLVISGWCWRLAGASPWIVLPVFVAVVTELQIKVEEQALRRVFGDAYEAYLKEVPRWVGRTRRTR